jgi:hypothetical protein
VKSDQQFLMLTPKAVRLEHLMAAGKSFDEAFAIVDREFTADGLLPRRGTTSLEAALLGGVAQGEPTHPGSFLEDFAKTVCRADPTNYPLLRPAVLALKAKFPKYRFTGAL